MPDRAAEALGDSERDVGLPVDARRENRDHARTSRGAAFSQMFVAHVEEDLVDQLFDSTEKGLARLLLLMANFGKEGKPEPVIAKISRETLAEMVGTTRSRVSHFMNKFRKAGFINYNGRLEAHSSLLTVVLADQPLTVESSS
jgi:CRP/FNR family transcriptional regulator, cyclic AMP receptor protein